MRTYSTLPAFRQRLKKLGPEEKDKTKKAILLLVDGFETGTLPTGLGLKKLSDISWEIRVGLHLRVIFRFDGDVVVFAFVGTHYDIRRFIKDSR